MAALPRRLGHHHRDSAGGTGRVTGRSVPTGVAAVRAWPRRGSVSGGAFFTPIFFNRMNRMFQDLQEEYSGLRVFRTDLIPEYLQHGQIEKPVPF
jgi:hypothetical protein